jgi:hypothetical protein
VSGKMSVAAYSGGAGVLRDLFPTGRVPLSCGQRSPLPSTTPNVSHGAAQKMNAHPYPSNRRQWLRAQITGALGLSWPGLSLPGLWQAQAAASEIASAMGQLVPRIRSRIFIFYYGGPSHLDTFDLKPQAPAEVRGEFQPVATTVPGLWICEHLPRMARQMHKVALVRSLHHANRLHDSASIETLTGRPSPHGDREEFSPIPQFFPGYGAILSYLWRERGLDVPHAALPFLICSWPGVWSRPGFPSSTSPTSVSKARIGTHTPMPFPSRKITSCPRWTNHSRP